MLNDLSIDIESLGIAEDSIVISIGAVVFNNEISLSTFNCQFYEILDLKDQESQKRTMSIDTVLWWMKQSEFTKSALIEKNRTSTYKALTLLNTLIQEYAVNYAWAKSPNFDLVILDSLYKSFNMKFAIDFRYWMDVRTIMRIRKTCKLNEIKMSKDDAHNALNDAYYQAKIVNDTLIYLSKNQ